MDLCAVQDQGASPKANEMELPHLLGPAGMTLGPHHKGMRKSPRGLYVEGTRTTLSPLLGLRTNIIEDWFLSRYGRKEAGEMSNLKLLLSWMMLPGV